MPLKTVKFHYEPRSPFVMLLRIAKYELDDVRASWNDLPHEWAHTHNVPPSGWRRRI
jgi:hypothetical protein